jgi:hypothetical protein
MSYDHDDRELSKDFIKYYQNLDALTEYFSGTRMHHKEHKIMRLGNMLFGDAEDGLKKLKKLFKDTTDPAAKSAYANFHNMLYEAMEKEDGEVSGNPIDYKMSEQKVEKTVTTFKELPENPPVVISIAEAKKRGFEMDNTDGWCTMTFAPIVITNPYVYDFFVANQEARNKNCESGNYTFWNPCVICTFGNKVAVDLHGTPYQFGMIVFDKKEVAVFYGLFDYAKVISKIQGKKLDKARIEALRDEYIAMECPTGSPIDGLDNPAIKLIDEAHEAIFAERYLRAVIKLEYIKPEDGDDVYNTSLIMLADMMNKKGDKVALKKVYETAKKYMPKYKEYWEEKLEGL